MIDWTALLHLASSAGTVHLIQWMKCNPKLSWISQHTKGLNRTISACVAICAAAGITYQMVGSWEAGSVITITVPPLQKVLTAIGNTLMSMGSQYLLQEGYYKMVVKPKTEE